MRIALDNCVSFIDVWKLFNTHFQRPHLKDAIQLDLNHQKVISPSLLGQVVGLSEEQTRSMSFSVLFDKFNQSQETEQQSRNFMIGVILTSYRRFCRECLGEGKKYQLIWQVKEIQKCSKHNTELTTVCPHCEKQQPYIWGGMVEGRCNYCGESLAVDSYSTDTMDSVEKRKYRDWSYLLSPKTTIAPVIGNERKFALGLSLLFLNQKEASLSLLKQFEYGKISRFVRGISSIQGISLSLLLRIIRTIGIEMQEYSRINLTEEEVSIYKEDTTVKSVKKKLTIGTCLATWCKGNGSSKLLVETSYKINKLTINDKLFTNLRICTGCWLRYGKNIESNEWEECDQVISIGHEKIRPLLNQNKSINFIQVNLGINQYNAVRFAGYLCYHKLVSKEVLDKYITFNTNSVDYSVFQKLLSERGSMYHNSRKLYGWSRIEYWYRFSTPEVQEFFFLEYERIKGPKKVVHRKDELEGLINEKIIIAKQTAKIIDVELLLQELSCTKTTLTRYGLHKKIQEINFEVELGMKSFYYELTDQFVLHANTKLKKFTYEEYFKHIGRSKKWVNKRFPDLPQYIQEQWIKNREIVDQGRVEEVLIKAIEIIKHMSRVGEPLQQNVVKKHLETQGYLLEDNSWLRSEVKRLLAKEAYSNKRLKTLCYETSH